MISVADALALLLDTVAPLDSNEVPLEAALGRTLVEDVVADRDFPPTDRSAMDGFAVRAADQDAPGRTLRLLGEVRAGESASGVRIERGAAVRIFTGAVVPEGADAVVMVENTVVDPLAGRVRVEEQTRPGQHIRRRGEDRREGDLVVARGAQLRPAEIAALAAVGRTRVRVVRPPRVAVISTGDEVVEADRTPAPHQVRNSNASMVLAQLQAISLQGSYLGIAPDRATRLDALIADGLTHDVLVLTGGVSVGEHDLVGAALLRAGCEVLFHRVAMRPGKPLLAARRGATLVLGLPGNPVSAFTGFHVFVAPALRRLAGDRMPDRAPIRATLTDRLPLRPGRLTYALARLVVQDDALQVTPVASASSGDVLALARANAFIVAEGADQPIAAGEIVEVEPWVWRSVVPDV